MTDTEMLKDAIKSSGYKMEFLAGKCGITRQSLTSKVQNESDFKANEIKILCDLLGITELSKKERIFFSEG